VSVITDSSDNLYVSDLGNNRILEYNAPFSQAKTQGFSANKVYGQAGSFTTNTCNNGGVSATSLCAPDQLAVDTHSNLYVADRSNNRVLEYTSGSTTATKEFGQGTTGTNFTSNSANNGGLSASSLNDPFGVATDAKNNVYIADFGNNRALEYNETANPPANFTANTVFGQSGSFITNNCNEGGLTANSLCSPHKLTLDSKSNLYISDDANDRVLEYNTPLTAGTTASLVFGQADSFTTNRCNFSAGPSADSLCAPVGVAIDGPQDLLVDDYTNNRVLKYLAPLATAGAAILAPSPEPFGNVAKGNTGLTKTVTATVAAGVPVLFTGTSITGTNAANFKVVTNTCSGYVKGGATCTAGLTFTPTAAVSTAESATLTLFDNGSNANQTDSLTGTSATQTTVLPTPVAFGNVPHGTTSAPITVTLTNNQSVAISLSPAPNISAGATTFAIKSTTCGASVAAFGSCTVSVTCAPATAASFAGTLTITDSPDSLSPHNDSLSCTGT
jgi:hypothetical protein